MVHVPAFRVKDCQKTLRRYAIDNNSNFSALTSDDVPGASAEHDGLSVLPTPRDSGRGVARRSASQRRVVPLRHRHVCARLVAQYVRGHWEKVQTQHTLQSKLIKIMICTVINSICPHLRT